MSKRQIQDETTIIVACIQMEPAVGEKQRNIKRSLEMIDEAAGRGARLLVMPELANSGYAFESRAEAFDLSEQVPNGDTCKTWAQACERHDAYIIAGINEREGDLLYNSAVVIGPAGYIGTFRKVYLWNEENLFFEPGNRGFPVFRTPIGRIGVSICYDGWFPEAYRLCALQGADIVLRAHELGANPRTAPGPPFETMSSLISRGEIGYRTYGVAIALEPARRQGQPLRDRRTDVYGEMLGSNAQPGWY